MTMRGRKVTSQEHNTEIPNTPSNELQYYRLEQMEKAHAEQHQEVLSTLKEIQSSQQRNNELLIEHDFRIKQLEAKNTTQSRYVYGIVIMVLTQVLAEIIQILTR